MVFSKKIIINLEKQDDIFHFEPLSDIHIGHVGFDEELYKRRIKAITKDPNRYTMFLGDQIDAISVYDKRFNPDMSIEHDVDNQRKIWEKLSRPLLNEHKSRFKEVDYEEWELKKGENEKIFGLEHGNHEYKIRETTRAYIENNFCNPHALSFLGSRAIIGLEVKYKNTIQAQWSILAIHGSGGGRPEYMFEQMKKNHYMDVFICGHLHQKRYTPQIAVDFDWETGNMWERDIHLINSGTFCKPLVEGTDGYMDRKNEITPTNIGTATLSFDSYNGTIKGHI